jgi:hypothetical protein
MPLVFPPREPYAPSVSSSLFAVRRRNSIGCGLLLVARAADVTITITGTVFSGTDQTGVFGVPKNTDLTGKPYTLTFTFDDTKGTEAFTSTGLYIENTSASNPGTAVLQIGDGSFGFGTLGFSPYSSQARVSAAGSVTNSEYSLIAGDGSYGSNWNDIQGTISPAKGTVLTTNPSWEAAFSNSNLAVYSPSDNYSLSFGIIETYPDNPALNMIASGYLTATSITVVGSDFVLDKYRPIGVFGGRAR